MLKFTQLVNDAPHDSDTGFKARVLNHCAPQPHLRHTSASLLTPGSQSAGWGASLAVSLGGSVPYPLWAAESEDTQGPHWALSTLPPTEAAPTCPLWERWRWWSSALMVSVAGCGSMFYKGWGPCPLLPVAPPGAPPAWQLGGVPWSSSGVTS